MTHLIPKDDVHINTAATVVRPAAPAATPAAARARALLAAGRVGGPWPGTVGHHARRHLRRAAQRRELTPEQMQLRLLTRQHLLPVPDAPAIGFLQPCHTRGTTRPGARRRMSQSTTRMTMMTTTTRL